MPGNALRGITYHIVGGNMTIDRLFRSEDGKATGLANADIVVFTGGTDVDPRLYGRDKHPQTQDPDVKRDKMEYAVYHNLDLSKQWKVGICRGAQFLNVMNGGTLWQHVEGHRQPHTLMYINETELQRAYNVSSTHHQMMIPPVKGGYVVWGWASESNIREFPNGKTIVLPSDGKLRDPEIIYYPKTNCLAFQPHPEYEYPRQTKDLFFRCLNRMIEA